MNFSIFYLVNNAVYDFFSSLVTQEIHCDQCLLGCVQVHSA